MRPLGAFGTLIAAGKVKAIGASNLTAWQLATAALAAQRDGVVGFTAVQPHYNLLYREDERDLIPLCAALGIRLLPWSPLARGRLARPPGAETERARTDDVADTLYVDADAAIVTALHALTAETGERPASLALAWLIARGTMPIFAATKPQHIADAARAATIVLDAGQIARLEEPYRTKSPVALPYSARNQADTATLPRTAS